MNATKTRSETTATEITGNGIDDETGIMRRVTTIATVIATGFGEMTDVVRALAPALGIVARLFVTSDRMPL